MCLFNVYFCFLKHIRAYYSVSHFYIEGILSWIVYHWLCWYHLYCGVARVGQEAMPQSQKSRMVGNGGPITGCLINRVTKYRGHNDRSLSRLSFPVLLFRKTKFIMQIGLRYKFSTSVTGCSPRSDRATIMSSFPMGVIANGY